MTQSKATEIATGLFVLLGAACHYTAVLDLVLT